MVFKRKYGKLDKQSLAKHKAAAEFAALTKGDDVSQSPAACSEKPLSSWSKPSPSKKQHQETQQATSTMEPSADNIAALVSMGICDVETAKRYLKAKNNSVEQAAASILDGEDIATLEASSSWDDRVWDADRNGNQDDDSNRNLRPLGSSTAPTRGPSPAGSFRHPGTKAQEDEDFALAMAASQGDLRYTEQEMGVIRADGTTQTHGPHQQEHYDMRQWAMVKVQQTTSEVVPDVDVVNRRHTPGQPRFLKNVMHGDYLPNFLTICHGIPAARELLLMPSYSRYDYGSNPDWWKGQPISLPKVVHTSDGSPTNPSLDRYDDFIAELQRLMAFLDASQRTYATSTNLEGTAGLARHGKDARSSTRTNVETFISELTAAAHSVDQSADVVERIFGLQAGSSDGSIDARLASIFDVAIEGEETSLSEQVDRILWDTEAMDVEPVDRYVETLPAIMVVRLKQHNPNATKLGVKAPQVLHMDKYLKENVEAVRPLRSRMARERQRVSKITEVQQKLQKWSSSRHSITVETDKLLAQSKAQLKPTGPDADMAHGGIAERPGDELAQKIDKIVHSIEDKLVILGREREKAINVLTELSSPVQAETLLGAPEHRYTLVGVSTKPTTTYLLRSREDSHGGEMIIDDQDDPETPSTMQWWRTEYSIYGTTASINSNPMAGYEALAAIEHEHTSALLVYASDEALDQRNVSDHNLTEALQEFVRQDNAFFEQELQDQPPPSYSFPDDGQAMQSIERKLSLDSLVAEGGSDAEMDHDPRTNASYGLGYGAETQYDDHPLVEIDPPLLDDHNSSDSGADMSHDDKPVQSWDDPRARGDVTW